jgi:hypothetical protein
MGLIFKTPADDAVEGTLRQLHMANQVDRVYERTWGWVKALVCSAIAVIVTSGFEYYATTSIYHESLVWTYDWVAGLFE